ncbi:hypothetical protein K469DRAFT_685098 [Zopfia rhizophila CBS 207.26]|uniref:Uncharacterized protein n=1 Tax=Zopfia rhizophila CBS 207.26 TaxID=1314779 RepID=A0A6A6ECV8_9PEZI|nr:hypothetical protein K469DRAFT_685098 [Zopfia rhizophila CBS 207.26]
MLREERKKTVRHLYTGLPGALRIPASLQKPPAHSQPLRCHNRKPVLVYYLSDSNEATAEVASYVNKEEWLIRAFYRRNKSEMYTMEFSLDHRSHLPFSPVERALILPPTVASDGELS